MVKVERKKDPVEEREKMRLNMQYLRKQLGSTVSKLASSQPGLPISAEKHKHQIKLAPLPETGNEAGSPDRKIEE